MNERLDELKTELSKVYGRFTKWRWRCQERNAETVEHQIRLAEEVLAESCSGSVLECYSYQLRLQRHEVNET